MLRSGARGALKLVGICLVLFCFSLASAQENPSTTPLSTATLPTAQAIKSCLDQAGGAECLDNLFRDALKEHSTQEVLQLIQRFESEDPELRRDCHPVVHAIGRETYRIKGNIHDSFSACDQTCHSGCYHGSVERFLRGDAVYTQVDRHPSAAELKQKAALACDPNIPVRLRFQCLHGLGHALMFFSRYQLAASLDACDGLPEEWSRNSCYGGVFMENISSATPDSRDLSPTDFHYPCDKLATKYRGECYVMQTSRMTEMGLGSERIFQECEKAGAFSEQCELSLGRDLSNDVRLGNSRGTAQKCELATGESRRACMRGVVYALVDNTWDGRYALPFCATFSQEAEQTACLKVSAEYLADTFEKSPTEIVGECSKFFNRPALCAGIASR